MNPYEANLELNRVEHELQHAWLRSMPRCLALVLSNHCNIGCIHCYQAKNSDNLLEPRKIGAELRREFAAFYPFLSTLRLQGGELFAIPGFSELLDDVAASTDRPIVSISTNGTLIDDGWAERIVRTPFHTVTISIDAATPNTFERLRRGAHLHQVLENTRRIQRWKEKLSSPYPLLDSFFVAMRSNFREIPEYVSMMRKLGMTAVALQTVEIGKENTKRFPRLGEEQSIANREEALELHRIVRETVERERGSIAIRTSGLTSLFEQHGLDAAFLAEKEHGLYPDGETLVANGGELCPNPWTTVFITENGDTYLCFLSEPVGNVYEEPLAAIWNSPRAVAKRARMTAGRYVASGCSQRWCGWREETKATLPSGDRLHRLRDEFLGLARHGANLMQPQNEPELAPLRRTMSDQRRRVLELDAVYQELCAINDEISNSGQRYIDELEAHVLRLSAEIERLQEGRRTRWRRRIRSALRLAGFG